MGDETECSSIDLCANDLWNIDFNTGEDPNLDRRYDDTAETTATTDRISISTQFQTTSYTSKKPLWWKRQSGRKISSRQRQAIQEIQKLGLQLKLPTTTRTKHENSIHKNISCEHDHQQKATDVGDIDTSQTPAPIGTRPQIDWDTVFPSYNQTSGDEIWLEIGFGLGDNLLCLASTIPAIIFDMNNIDNDNPPTCRKFYVGAEMHKGGVGTICTRIQSANHERTYWKDFTLYDTNIDSNTMIHHSNVSDSTTLLYSNVRLHMGDGIKLLPFIPDNSLSAILITFPDPFMGTNQSSYRILQLDVLDQIRRVLISSENVAMNEDAESTHHSRVVCPGGRLYLATDHFGYHEWSHDQVSKFNDQKNVQNGEDSSNTNVCLMMNDDNNSHFFAKSKQFRGTFKRVDPTPDRSLWLPVVSKYEQKGYDEGRKTYLSCWEAM